MAWSLFGFQIVKQSQIDNNLKEPIFDEPNKSFAAPQQDDGAITVTTGSGHFGSVLDLDSNLKNEIDLITRYRDVSIQPELDTAIDEICNEAIVTEDNSMPVEINTDELKIADTIKTSIRAEFDNVLKLLDFKSQGHSIFKRWYIDGRLNYHAIIDPENTIDGIKELRYIDPRRIRKIREIIKAKDPKTGADIVQRVNEYYIFNEFGIIGTPMGVTSMGVRIAKDAIINVNSGLMDSKMQLVLSYLHGSIKPLNMLRMMEDAAVVSRVARAPDRRVFYIDVGDLQGQKAENYVKNIMNKFRNKVVYDASTGEIKNSTPAYMSILEDFWIPRFSGNRGTEVTNMPGLNNQSSMQEDLNFFKEKLYNSLHIPVSRLIPQTGFSLGRTTEITREELKFAKFIQKLRKRFSQLFDDVMRINLVLKKICTADEWDSFKASIWYDFLKDNNFEELKEAELIMNRAQTMQLIDPYVGQYVSQQWVRKNVLRQTDDDIKQEDAQIAKEQAAIADAVRKEEASQFGMPQQDGQQPFGNNQSINIPNQQQQQPKQPPKQGNSNGGPRKSPGTNNGK